MMIRPTLLSAAASAIMLISFVGLAQEGGPHAGADRAAPEGGADQRAAIALSGEESAFIRREMRGLLESMRDILEASAAGDRARLVEAARRAGLNGPEAQHIPKSVAPKLPPAFKQLGLATHRGFDQIALEVERSGAVDQAPRQLVALMSNCLGCHAAWRLVDEPRP